MGWQFFNDNSAAIQVIITFILVGITWKYVIITNNILKEQEKSRKISFIERRLEKFYYPLKNFIEDPAYVPIDRYGGSSKDFKLDKIDKIVLFEYLILSNELKDKIKEFFNELIKAKQDDDLESYVGRILKIISSKNTQILKEIIDQDIQTLQEELDELV